jgi:ankyrin repeat protein
LALSNSHAIPLHYMVRLAIEKDDPNEPEFLKVVKAMITEGADVNARDMSGRTPLASVCTRGRNLNCVQTLLEHNAAVNNVE